MPHNGEVAGKHGHMDILSNPDVQGFLDTCVDVPKPSEEELTQEFASIPNATSFGGTVPSLILAIDGSTYESPVDGRYPSRMVGYIKVGTVLLDMKHYESIKQSETRFINPMEVARLQKETGAISLALPGAYVQSPNCASAAESYRCAIQQYLQSDRTKLAGKTLFDTLLELTNRLGLISENDEVKLSSCPNSSCSSDGKIFVPLSPGHSICSTCGARVFVSDLLRTHEAFSENGSNIEAYNRLMSTLEHLLLAHNLLYLKNNNLSQLSDFCILIDGPLAIFGQSARFYRALMLLIDDIRQDLSSLGLQEPLVMGITKTGRVCEHFAQVNHLVPPSKVFPVKDSYRYKYIEPAKFGSDKNFGDETYYGQDFMVKTAVGRRFNLCLAYPYPDKSGDFKRNKSDLSNYDQIGRALKVIEKLESDLYENSMIPVVLAHRHASISLKPGGKVLDVLSQSAFKHK